MPCFNRLRLQSREQVLHFPSPIIIIYAIVLLNIKEHKVLNWPNLVRLLNQPQKGKPVEGLLKLCATCAHSLTFKLCATCAHNLTFTLLKLGGLAAKLTLLDQSAPTSQIVRLLFPVINLLVIVCALTD